MHGCKIDENDEIIVLPDGVHCYRVIKSDYSLGGYFFDYDFDEEGNEIKVKSDKSEAKKKKLKVELGIEFKFDEQKKKWVVKKEDLKKLKDKIFEFAKNGVKLVNGKK